MNHNKIETNKLPSKIIHLCSQELENNDLNFAKIVKLFGVNCESFYVTNWESTFDYLNKSLEENEVSLAINYKALYDIISKEQFVEDFKNLIFSKNRYLFVYNLSPGNLESSVLQFLTDGLINTLSCFESNNHFYQISNDEKEITKQFSGLTFGPIRKDCDFIFLTKNTNKINTLISINSEPFFVKIKRDKCDLFLIANNSILDIESKVLENFSIINYFSRIVPVVMYLKYVFRNLCWSSSKTYASFILDDPLLRPNYGFLNYERLLQLMNNHYFSTNIAFIPWNYRRTSGYISRMFLKRPDKFTISIHGCDHTGKEFGSNSHVELNKKVKMARKRMQIHQRKTGIKCDNVMVFPQGVFSQQAMRILKCNNLLAAVNTEVIPYGDEAKEIEISQLLDVSITKYESFPLFIRRYPNEVVDFAFDMFMGKPVFIVEHHDYLKNGYDGMTDFIESINLLDEDIHWDGLENIIKKSYLERISLNGNVYVKIYSNNCEIRNMSNNYNKYIVTKKECGNIPILSVTVDGKNASYKLEDQLLSLSIDIPPDKTVNLKINYKDIYPDIVGKYTIKESIKVYFRRYLSEFRDNYMSKSDFLLSIANKIKKFI